MKEKIYASLITILLFFVSGGCFIEDPSAYNPERILNRLESQRWTLGSDFLEDFPNVKERAGFMVSDKEGGEYWTLVYWNNKISIIITLHMYNDKLFSAVKWDSHQREEKYYFQDMERMNEYVRLRLSMGTADRLNNQVD